MTAFGRLDVVIDTAAPTTRLIVLVAVLEFASLTVTCTEEVPAADGVPEITPVDAFRLNPVGKPVADQLYGVVPPEAANVWA